MITVTDKEGKKIDLPTRWADTSTELFQKYVKLWDKEDRILLFCIQSGYDYDLVRKSRRFELQKVIDKTTLYPFIESLDFNKLPIPTIFKLRDRWITLPKSIEDLTIEQNMVIKDAMAKVVDLKELISLAVAVYLQPIYDDGEFDHVRYKELEQDILKMSIIETYPIGFFLLSRLVRSGKDGSLSYRQVIAQLTRNVTSLQNWLTLRNSTRLPIYLGLTNMQKRMAFFRVWQGKRSWATSSRC